MFDIPIIRKKDFSHRKKTIDQEWEELLGVKPDVHYIKQKNGMMACGIYAIVCPPTKSVYIGQSKNVPQRLRNHKNSLKTDQYSWRKEMLQEDYHKYGNEFVYMQVEDCDEVDLFDREAFWMLKYAELGYTLYNKTTTSLVQKTIRELKENINPEMIRCPQKHQNIIERVIIALESGVLTEDMLEQGLSQV